MTKILLSILLFFFFSVIQEENVIEKIFDYKYFKEKKILNAYYLVHKIICILVLNRSTLMRIRNK